MELLIVRHAIAFERNRRRWTDDGERPLTPAGKKLARKAAAGLREFAAAPHRLLSSPLVRARDTARILTKFAGWPEAEKITELEPGKPALAILRLLRLDGGTRVAVVGHEPGLGKLLAVCLLGNPAPLPVDFKKIGVACVKFAGAPRAGRATLQWFATPRMLRALSS